VRKNPCSLRHVALTIAGSDSSAAAGVQGDLKTFSALGVYACTVITAITAQNTREIRNVTPLEADLVSRQISSIIRDIPPTAVKVGMIHNSSAIRAAANALGAIKCPIVLDPVMHATNKATLMEEDALHSLLSTLAPILHVITPNIVEAERISGQRIKNQEDISNAAKKIQTLEQEMLSLREVMRIANYQRIIYCSRMGKQSESQEIEFQPRIYTGLGVTFQQR
jgi:hydroxymethylpyrimidine kinase/phosphomethylpyrimidine kinase